MKDEPYLIVKSPVPFVLIGAARGDPGNPDKVLVKNPDRVLVRGGDAEIDLVGFVREKEVSHDYGDSASYGSLFTRKRFRLVRSEAQPPSSAARDQRHSTYVLAWKGAARTSYEIEAQFNKSLPDVLAAIDDNSLPQTEWALARVIFLVQRNETLLDRRQLLFAITIIITAIVIGLTTWLSLLSLK